MKELVQYQNNIIRETDLLYALRSVGLKSGDAVCVHSDLMSIGKPLIKRDEFLSCIINCFWKIIGSNGTLIMPTFSYSFCEGSTYNKLTDKSKMGVLSEYFRNQDGVIRTNDPIFSFAIGGKNKDKYMQETKSCFGKNSVYGILLLNGGKIIHFGNIKQGFTFSHFIEENIGIEYRFFKEFSGDIIYENGLINTKKINYYVRYLDRQSRLSVDKNIKLLVESNNFSISKIGGGEIALMDTKRYYSYFSEAFKKDRKVLLVD